MEGLNEGKDIMTAPLCTCRNFSTDGGDVVDGKHVSSSSSPRKTSYPHQSRSANSSRSNAQWLESSFVHLTAPPRRPLQEDDAMSGTPYMATKYYPQGFWEQHQHMQALVKASSPDTYDDEKGSIPLCADCTDRVAQALEEDTVRLQGEVQAYQEAVAEARQRAKTYGAISIIPLEQAVASYEEEIALFQQEVQAREAELVHLHSLWKEQLSLSKDLEEFADQVQQDQNSLELDSRAFDYSVRLLTDSLVKVQTEVDQLSFVRLPLCLFDLQVDERGLRYPLINLLRLAFRPKGDASEQEIRAAWSQATQLLLTLGSLLQYRSNEWKLVPLADCAKLIYRKEIFNMKPGDCRTLMAWNALLDQVIRHAKTKWSNNQSLPPPPYNSSPSSIGNTELARLDRTDHVSWSRVIHRMASNLFWLSERVSELVALQVSSLAHSIA